MRMSEGPAFVGGHDGVDLESLSATQDVAAKQAAQGSMREFRGGTDELSAGYPMKRPRHDQRRYSALLSDCLAQWPILSRYAFFGPLRA
jgi:ribosomal protein S6E (S10)